MVLVINRLAIIALCFLISSCSFSLGRNTCVQEIRGALDIGSGSTKAVAVEINTCSDSFTKVIWEDSRALALKEDLLKHNKLSEKIYGEAKLVLSELVQELKKQGAIHISGVATMAMRQAPNGREFLRSLSGELKIPLRVITQEEEAALGAVSARTLRPDVVSDVIWDIGGASAQWVFKTNSKTDFVLSDLASVSFKDLLLKNMKRSTSTPNPLGRDGLAKAEILAMSVTRQFPTKLSESIQKSSGLVLGVGGVHRFSVLGNLVKLGLIPEKAQGYEVPNLEAAIKARYLLDDSEIGGDFAATDVTNLVLVYTQMKALGISRVEVAKGNLALGLVVHDLLKDHGANDL